MNRRIETYIILGIYFALGLVCGYALGKESVKNNHQNHVELKEEKLTNGF